MVDWADLKKDYTKHTRIVFLGKTGTGKSSSINNLVGKKILKSEASSNSVTYNCQAITANILGEECLIVDTPGLYDTERSQNEIFKELKEVMEFTYPGIHVFVIVISIGRFTEEEQKTVDYITKYFGKDIRNFGILLFTRLDDLQCDDNVPLEDYIRKNKKLDEFARVFDKRYIGFNNRIGIGSFEQTRREFIYKIKLTKQANHGNYYTTQLFKSSQKAFALELKRIEEEKMSLEEKNKQIEEMNRKHQEALKRLQEQNMKMLNEMKMSIDQKNEQIKEMGRIHQERLQELQNQMNLALNKMEKSKKKQKRENEKLREQLKVEKEKGSHQENLHSTRSNHHNMKILEKIFDSMKPKYPGHIYTTTFPRGGCF